MVNTGEIRAIPGKYSQYLVYKRKTRENPDKICFLTWLTQLVMAILQVGQTSTWGGDSGEGDDHQVRVMITR